jgi:hypothetical protein
MTKLMDTPRRVDEAATEFDEHEGRKDGRRVAGNLSSGLSQLRNTLYHRIHDDVEKVFGMDSMIMPISASKTETNVKAEIEVYELALCESEVAARGYVRDVAWFRDWAGKLRLGQGHDSPTVAKRITQYLAQSPEDRRLSFSNILERATPEARKAPLILHRLLPLAVSIATALAFDDRFRAAELRNEQLRLLPSIGDCHDCHGRPLEAGEACSTCGNPLWKFQWLNAAD